MCERERVCGYLLFVLVLNCCCLVRFKKQYNKVLEMESTNHTYEDKTVTNRWTAASLRIKGGENV